MYSPKDTQTSVIYWVIIWSPVAYNISGLGLLASTQNDVWSEELHLWTWRCCKSVINSVLDLSLNAYCKKSLNSVLELLKLNWNTLTHEHTLCLAPWSAPFPLNPAGSPGRPATDTDRGGKGRKRGFGWRGLDTTIFCPAGVDMHGRPNRLRRARQGGTLHTSGVTGRLGGSCVCAFSRVCRS